jgi:hypothetical protein
MDFYSDGHFHVKFNLEGCEVFDTIQLMEHNSIDITPLWTDDKVHTATFERSFEFKNHSSKTLRLKCEIEAGGMTNLNATSNVVASSNLKLNNINGTVEIQPNGVDTIYIRYNTNYQEVWFML